MVLLVRSSPTANNSAPKMYLEMYFRGENNYRPDKRAVNLEVKYCWWEGPDDFHIQLELDPELNLYPEYFKREGDYVLPYSDWLAQHLKFEPVLIEDYRWNNRRARRDKVVGAVAYSLGLRPDPALHDGGVVAPEEYHELVLNTWSSPNRSEA